MPAPAGLYFSQNTNSLRRFYQDGPRRGMAPYCLLSNQYMCRSDSALAGAPNLRHIA